VSHLLPGQGDIDDLARHFLDELGVVDDRQQVDTWRVVHALERLAPSDPQALARHAVGLLEQNGLSSEAVAALGTALVTLSPTPQQAASGARPLLCALARTEFDPAYFRTIRVSAIAESSRTQADAEPARAQLQWVRSRCAHDLTKALASLRAHMSTTLWQETMRSFGTGEL
jgi:hypothetical protein